MTPQEYILKSIKDHSAAVQKLFPLVDRIETLSNHMITALKKGGKIVFMGNGGSAADCQHLSAEFVGRFQRERQGLPALALTKDTSIITAIGNDYGFENVFSRQVEAMCTPQDLLVGISTSGNSDNVYKAIEAGKNMGLFTVGLTGKNGGRIADACDLPLIVPEEDTARIQEMHILIGHTLCGLVEQSV